MAKGSMRDKMPGVASLIDDLRAAFGAESIDRVLAAGMRGEPVFSATENGHTVGTAVEVGTRVLNDESGRPCVVTPDGKWELFVADKGRRDKLKRTK